MRGTIALLSVLMLAGVSRSDEKPSPWPRFRGPGGSGVADGQKPPVEFGPKKNVKWKVAVPAGLSSPIVVGNTLVLTAFDGGKLYTIAYSRKDGHELWRAEATAKKIEPYNKGEGSPAASTPATDGKRIVSYFGSCGLFCYDLSGKELWTYKLPTAATMFNFGSGVSPVIADGLVVLLRDESKDPKIIVINAATGKLKWEKKRDSRVSYCTPAVWKTKTGTQIVAPGFGRMIGYDLHSGKETWYVVGMPAGPCASPMVAGGDLFFAAWSPGDPTEKSKFKMPTFDDLLNQMDKDKDGAISKKEAAKTQFESFFNAQDTNKDGKITRNEWDAMIKFLASSRNSAFVLKPGGKGNITATHVRWKQKKGLPYVPSGIAYRGQFVLVKDGGIVTAYDAKTGDQLYQRRAVQSGKYYASPVAANGRLYFTSLHDGTVTVIKAGGKQPAVVVKNPPLGERVAATPAIADNTIYIRTAGHLYAFSAKE